MSEPKPVTRLRSPKVSELLARQIVDQILTGSLTDGEPLQTEREMMAAYGVGRSTVREALRLLETRGVVTIKQGLNGGPIVRIPRATDLSESLSLFLSFAGASLQDLLTTRLALEPVIAVLAAEHASASDVTELDECVARMKSDLGDAVVFREENELFHTIVARIAGNPVLLTFIESVKGISDGMTVGVTYSERRRLAVVEAHARIVRAIGENDQDHAREEMQRHLEEAGAYWRKRYGPIYRQPVDWSL
jgi:GntR family transcriptional regulator, transcriptional repressor for pyruvate dehydrogenase complex